MAEYNQTTNGQQNPTQGTTSTNATTLKLVQNKRYVGPKHEGLKAKTNLSSPAGKILINNNLKVEVKKDNVTTAQIDKPVNTIVAQLPITAGVEGSQAALYMLAWDKLYPTIGSDAYQAKYEALVRARSEAYTEIGISPNSSAKERPNLTVQQRELYNAKVLPYAFSYYEYQLSFKQGKLKAVKSKVYRTLQPVDVHRMSRKLLETAQAIGGKLSIKPKAING